MLKLFAIVRASDGSDPRLVFAPPGKQTLAARGLAPPSCKFLPYFVPAALAA